MKKKNTLVVEAEIRCPCESCGWIFHKKITIEYITNQKGDVVSHKALP